MIVGGKTAALPLLLQHRWLVVACIVIAGGAEVLNDVVDLNRPVFSFAAVALLGTALSISLVFRVNEAYARWWEARTLWGEIVNQSRSWARQILGLVPDGVDPELESIWRRLIYRQIAYVNSLRLQLRGQTEPEALGPFLSAKELASLEGHPNPPTEILQKQARDLSALRSSGAIDQIAMHRLDTTLSLLTEAQGGCERIKNTDFPDRVAYFTRASAWLMAGLIPILVMKPQNDLDVIDYFVTPVLMLAYLFTERIGAELKRPFENLANDTPMTALCRTIEIDLRSALGERDLPGLIEPEKGILM